MKKKLPTQVPVLEATMRAVLINSVLPEKVTSMPMQRGALKVHELLFLTFQAFLPPEPSARVDGPNTVDLLRQQGTLQRLSPL